MPFDPAGSPSSSTRPARCGSARATSRASPARHPQGESHYRRRPVDSPRPGRETTGRQRRRACARLGERHVGQDTSVASLPRSAWPRTPVPGRTWGRSRGGYEARSRATNQLVMVSCGYSGSPHIGHIFSVIVPAPFICSSAGIDESSGALRFQRGQLCRMPAAAAAAPSGCRASAHLLLASVSAARLPRPWRACFWNQRRRASAPSCSKNRPLRSEPATRYLEGTLGP